MRNKEKDQHNLEIGVGNFKPYLNIKDDKIMHLYNNIKAPAVVLTM